MKPYTIGLYEKAMPACLSWKDKLEFTKSIGFDFLEISIDETDEKLSRLDMSEAERLALLDTFRIIGIPIRTMCLSGHRRYPLGSHDPKIAEKSLEIIQKAIQLADDLGIRIIQLAGYDVYYEASDNGTRRRFFRNLIKSVEMAASKGVMLAFETMETEFMNTVSKAMRLTSRLSSPYLGIYPDAGNLTNASILYKSDVLEDIRTGKSKIVAMHLKETKPGIFREVHFGTGHVNFESIIKTAWDIGVRKYVIEMWYTNNNSWKEDISNAFRQINQYLLKVCYSKILT